jgi:hypothetical protein
LWFVNVHVHNAEADAVIQYIADAELVAVQSDGVALQRINLGSCDCDDAIDVRCNIELLDSLSRIVRDGHNVVTLSRNNAKANASIASRYIDA